MAEKDGRLQQSELNEGAKYKDIWPSLLAAQDVIQDKVESAIEDYFRQARSGQVARPQFNADYKPGFPVVYSRVKSWDSCRARIAERHKRLEDLPDLIGCRIVVIHSEEIRPVTTALGSLLRRQKRFAIDHDAGAGRSRGYSGIYYTIPLGHDDVRRFCGELPEPAAEHLCAVADFRLELQIHTVMEEAWSRVSHAGFYKASEGIPNDVHRKLQRLASTSKLLDDHLKDLSMSIEKARRKLKKKFDNENSRAKVKIDEFLLWYCTGNPSYRGILTEFAELGLAAGFQKSEWQDLVVVGDETDICLEVCRRTELTTWGALDKVFWTIEERRERWKTWLQMLVDASKRAREDPPFNRPLLVFSIVRLLESPGLPSIDTMYPRLWRRIYTVHRLAHPEEEQSAPQPPRAAR